ncbi:MAG: alpha/beta family hydrolase [Acidimicrobiia bacterium]|nr:alpha/beta family hydrolase [Acidimicrobiia bacterium]
MRFELPGGGTVSGVVRGHGDTTVLLAHGAGTDQHHRMVVGIADALAAAGLRVVTFNYPYTEAGRRRPDRAAVLLECHRVVAERVRDEYGSGLVLAGRSMGGRMGTMLAADGYPCRAVVCYAYPLHPAGKPEKLRIEHLPDVACPMLFFQGSRDALSRSDLFDRHVRPLPNATVVDMEGADHSFRGRGWSEPGLFTFLAEETASWLASRR